MKHSIKITAILLGMFLVAQLIGIAVIYSYSPKTEQIVSGGNVTNVTNYNLPYGFEPPKDLEKQNPWNVFWQIAISFAIVILVYLGLMKFGFAPVLKTWFLVVITIALAVSINAAFRHFVPYSTYVSLALGLGFASLKMFRRGMILHNFTELLIYPGIAALIVAMFSSYTSIPILLIVLVLVAISIYDIYAVWHAGFMQKMAKYQINKMKVFAGFFVPYIRKEDRLILEKAKKNGKNKKIKATVAILGGGDVVWPMILAGIVFIQFGFVSSLIIIAGATIALLGLFISAEKGRFYPAMPFITSGCFIALGIVYLLQLI